MGVRGWFYLAQRAVMRTMFTLYLVFIVLGITYFTVIGLTHH
jgi:hypothetical protein